MTLAFREAQDVNLENVVNLWKACELTRPWNDPYKDIKFAREGATSAVGTLIGVIATADENIDALVAGGGSAAASSPPPAAPAMSAGTIGVGNNVPSSTAPPSSAGGGATLIPASVVAAAG